MKTKSKAGRPKKKEETTAISLMAGPRLAAALEAYRIADRQSTLAGATRKALELFLEKAGFLE